MWIVKVAEHLKAPALRWFRLLAFPKHTPITESVRHGFVRVQQLVTVYLRHR